MDSGRCSTEVIAERFRERFGRQPWLIGSSRLLDEVWEFLEAAAEVDLPVLLVGEPGTSRRDAARILHLLGGRRRGPFILGDLSSLTRHRFVAELYRWIAAASRGTLFLASIDELDLPLQARLAEMLELGLTSRWQDEDAKLPAVRLAASVGLGNGAADNQPTMVHRALREELGFLVHEMPPLRKRPEDIPPLARHFLASYGGCGLLSAASEEALCAFSWPGNISQLRHVAAKLAAYAGSDCIELDDLRSHTSWLLESEPGVATVPSALSPAAESCGPDTCGHPMVDRALSYLRNHLDQRITLATLARHCQVSQSHLSHLFKQHLDVSPVAWLTRRRIEQATHLLTAKVELTITEIAGRVGFGDLRHFERTFKRLVGVAPRVYREQISSRNQSGEASTDPSAKATGGQAWR